MMLLQIERLTKSFGTDLLFEPFSTQVARGDRIALIGDNGVGKSTILDILAGDLAPSDGRVHRIGETRLARLPQVARLHGEGTLWSAMETPFEPLRHIERTLRDLEESMASGTADEASMHAYDEWLHRFDERGGYQIEATIRSALRGVGFRQDEFDKPIGVLSGGEEARAALARALLEGADLLLLDEPTNHLDFEALDWLEEQLLQFDGGLILVSHDRHLLDRVTNRTWEIALGQVRTYRVGYGHSRSLREAERERVLTAFEKQEETIERYKEFVRRNKAGQKVKQAKDRERKLERIESERVEPPRDAKRIALRIERGEPSGKRVLSLRTLEVGFDGSLFEIPDVDVFRGEKVAIVGPNGCGKTTLLKAIAGERRPLAGRVDLGHNVVIATYSQTQEGLHGRGTVLDAVLSRTQLTISEARGLLGRFLFTDDDVLKKMSALSGGERSRVALALLSLVEGNLLLFDEPTNHLDLASQEILQDALDRYPGTILLVSHDRALLEAITTRVWQVADGRMSVHGRGYLEYRRRLDDSTVGPPERVESTGTKPKRSTRAREDSARSKRLAQAEREREEAEIRVEDLEAQMAGIEARLEEASTIGDAAEIARLGTEHNRLREAWREAYARWEALVEEGRISP